MILTKDRLRDSVGKLRELCPLAVGGQKEMFKLAPISVGDGGEEVVSVAGGAELNFGDAREILPKNVGVLTDGSPELVKIDLLEEIEIRGGALAQARVVCVIEARGIRIPSEAAAGGASIDPGIRSWRGFPEGRS